MYRDTYTSTPSKAVRANPRNYWLFLLSLNSGWLSLLDEKDHVWAKFVE